MAKAKQTKTAQTDDYVEHLEQIANAAKDQVSWMDRDYSGQLAVDVYQTDSDIIIRAAIAGVRAEDIDISVQNDMVTIKGVRQLTDEVPAEQYLYQECYWGGFSRSIILPCEVSADGVKASLKNGILRVTMPKIERPAIPPIAVVEEEEE